MDLDAEESASKTGEPEIALACDMQALTLTERQRYNQLLADLQLLRMSKAELPQGYRFEFPSNSLSMAKLAEFIALEHLCCPFFNFVVELRSGQPSAWLSITGTPEAKQLLEIELPL
jgi:hypothetical protein